MSPSIWQLLIVLAIVLLLFGAKRLRHLGTDLGSAVKGFKSALRDGEDEQRRDESAGRDDAGDDGGRLGRGEDDDGDHRFEGEREGEDRRN